MVPITVIKPKCRNPPPQRWVVVTPTLPGASTTYRILDLKRVGRVKEAVGCRCVYESGTANMRLAAPVVVKSAREMPRTGSKTNVHQIASKQCCLEAGNLSPIHALPFCCVPNMPRWMCYTKAPGQSDHCRMTGDGLTT